MKKAVALLCCLALIGRGRAQPTWAALALVTKLNAKHAARQARLLHQIQLVQTQCCYPIIFGI